MINRPAPSFRLAAVEPTHLEETVVSLPQYQGRWLVLVFYPRDFSWVCPTELMAISQRLVEFSQRDAAVVGISTDPIAVHRRWMQLPPEQGGVLGLKIPLASDTDGAISRQYGVYLDEERVAARGLVIIDPSGVVQYLVVHAQSVGRQTTEVLRVLDALQTGGLCPEGWHREDETLNAAANLGPGRVISHYQIDRLIGEGTAGRVFLAQDRVLQRPVALKVLPTENAEQVEQILTEARVAASLIHPNICTIYAIETDGGVPLIVMEFLDGPTLAELLDGQPISRAAAESMLRQIAEALAMAHHQGIAHGDLKPANVVQTADWTCKVLDFGLARSESLPATPPAGNASRGDGAQPVRAAAGNADTAMPRREFLTVPSTDLAPSERASAERDGWNLAMRDPTASPTVDQRLAMTLVDERLSQERRVDASPELSVTQERGRSSVSVGLTGTPLYMAPERWQGEPPTTAGDVYALGLMAYELYTGERALKGRSVAELAMAVEKLDGEAVAAALPSSTRRWVAAALTRDPGSRATIDDILRLMDAS